MEFRGVKVGGAAGRLGSKAFRLAKLIRLYVLPFQLVAGLARAWVRGRRFDRRCSNSFSALWSLRWQAFDAALQALEKLVAGPRAPTGCLLGKSALA